MTPACGDEIRVSWAPGAPVFYGFIVIVQQDWRLGNLQPPWLAVQCQDAMFRFDARFVTYRFPAQSVTQSIAVPRAALLQSRRRRRTRSTS